MHKLIFGLVFSILSCLSQTSLATPLTWPDKSVVALHFVKHDPAGSTAWTGSTDFFANDGNEVNVSVPRVLGSGDPQNLSISLFASDDGSTVHGDFISYWVKYQITWEGQGLTGSDEPRVSARIGISGFDPGNVLASIDNAEVPVPPPFFLNPGSTFPIAAVTFVANDIRFAKSEVFRVNYSRAIPEPGTLGLLLFGFVGFRLRRKLRHG